MRHPSSNSFPNEESRFRRRVQTKRRHPGEATLGMSHTPLHDALISFDVHDLMSPAVFPDSSGVDLLIFGSAQSTIFCSSGSFFLCPFLLHKPFLFPLFGMISI